MFRIDHLVFPFRHYMQMPDHPRASLFSLALERVVLKRNHKPLRKFDTKTPDRVQGSQDVQYGSTHPANTDIEHEEAIPDSTVNTNPDVVVFYLLDEA